MKKEWLIGDVMLDGGEIDFFRFSGTEEEAKKKVFEFIEEERSLRDENEYDINDYGAKSIEEFDDFGIGFSVWRNYGLDEIVTTAVKMESINEL